MKVSTKYFNQTQIDTFGKMNKEIQKVQERISSGRNIVRASDDPVTAVKLSAAKEQRNLLDRFERNADAAYRRLNMAENALTQSINTITRIGELAVQAANGSYGPGEREAIAMEAEQLIKHMVELANTQDAQGQSIFSGYKTDKKAFELTKDGQINYNGDRGQTYLQVSENMQVLNGLDGESVFGRVQTDGGPKSIFTMLEGMKRAILNGSILNTEGNSTGVAELEFSLPRDPLEFTFSLTGSAGTTRITTSMAEGKFTDFVDAINADSNLTGITAEYDDTIGRVRLTDSGNKNIRFDDIEIEDIETSSDHMSAFVDFFSIDGEGQQVGVARRLTDDDLLLSNLTGDINSAINHISNQQALIGSQLNKANQQISVLGERKIAVSEEVSELGDADLAELVTRLQSLLLNRDASQQAFAKIGQQSLFDYIR